MDVEQYLQQFTTTVPNEKLSQNETNNSSINNNELTNLESNTNNSVEEVISPKLDGDKPSADVACGGDELTDSVKADGVADVACSGESELTDSVKVDGKECGDSGVADDVAGGGNSELTDSVKVDGVADVACGGESELTDSVKVDGKECGESGVVADVACGGDSELTDSVKVDGVECEDKIIGESEPEGVKMDVTSDIEVAKGGEAVTEGQDDVAKQNDEGDDMVTDRKDDVNEGVEAEIVVDKKEGKTDDLEKQNDKEEEEVEVKAVKRRGRPRKSEESSPVERRGRPKKRVRNSSKATPKSKSVKMSDNEEDEDDDEDFEVVGTPSSIKRRGRPRKSGGSTAKATPKSTSVKMSDSKEDEDEDVEAMETPAFIERRGRPRKSGGNSAKATPKSTSVKMVEKEEKAENKDVETKSSNVPIKRRGRPRKSEGNSAKAAPKSTSVKTVEKDEDVEVVETELSVKTVEKDEDVEAVETELPDSTIKKLGRSRKSGGNSQKATPKSASAKVIAKEREEEDVCFICFDGGELVLCDKRDCPKAYHHSCVDRDEAFFQTKGQWNCGWHLCSVCSKKAEYMCYTCTFSLCKACAKTNVIFCVREEEKKGFCEPCMKIVMLIENKSQETQEGVDFDDKDSWEYMFKEYWTDMKPKLNISLAELLEAKNAWKGSSPAGEQEPPAVHSDGGSGSENPSENPESQTKKRRRESKKQKTIDSAFIASEGTPVPESENTQWATEELLEFVAHMGNNNKSYQSQFDVQALLLEYIKTNKLRDPRKKSQIICDARLTRLFNKPRVGHFEMLKLLESHFLIKEDSQIDKSVVDTEVGLVDDDEDYETAKRDRKDKKRKIRKKADREPQSNREDFAAIDVHNINLIYLKRKFLEDLLDDTETFNSKVVSTFVRIRIQGANNKQDIYRLVQVTGTTKGEHYAVGKKMTDTMLEILNLDKTESVSIDIISNHDFTEDECKRLRQSMKCGLIKSPKVGDILDKAIELQAVRVNDWLEAEVVRISHLRDRASDLGRKKELRECVEKLQLLKTPEERAHRIQDIPVIHDDSTMDPNHESDNDADENDKKQDMYKSYLSSNSSKRRDYPSKESWSSTGAGTSRSSGKNYELSRSLSDNKVEDVTAASFKPHNENLWDQGRDVVVQPPSILKKPSSTNETEKNMVPTEDVSEMEKMWHYRDPSGKIQGPFTMAQLRKWNNSKFFPVDLRIWKKSEKEGDSVLLTDALEGRFSTANLPSPTPNRTIANSGLVVPYVVPSLYHGGNEGLQSPTPLGTGQNLSVRPYSGSGDPQPSPNMGSGNQSMNWGTASQGSWAVAAGPSNVSPGWVASCGPSQGSRGSGNGNSKSVGSSSSSPTARNRSYKRSGFSEDKRDRHRSSGFHDDRRNRDKHRSFNSRRRSRDYDRY